MSGTREQGNWASDHLLGPADVHRGPPNFVSNENLLVLDSGWRGLLGLRWLIVTDLVDLARVLV